ncbi:MAG: hypothetical protein ASARMPREDX12_003414 [Alectoria sarmentosa]|nr:MAG: hypothetical protein ASARMPREDX12_003414 [Alectoria sarmentosa]
MSADMMAAYNGVLSGRFPKHLDKNATVVPVGLDFGPTWISTQFSIDRANLSSGSYFTGVPGGQVYTGFYQEALSNKVQSHLDSTDFSPSAAPLIATEERAAELVRASARHIEDARLMGVWALDKNPRLDFRVMAITVPDHWDVSARTVVAKAARLAGQPLDGSHMILKLPRAVQSAYTMQRYTTGKYLTVLIYYHKSHLHLMLVQMCETGCVMKGQVWLPHLGEDVMMKTAVVSSAVDSDDETLENESPGDDISSEEPVSDDSLNEKPLHDSPPHDTSPQNTWVEGDALRRVPLNDAPTPEPSTSTHPSNDNNASPNDIYTEPPAYRYPRVNLKPTQESLRTFIHLTIPSPNSTPAISPSRLLKDAASNIEYIIIDGSASPLGARALRLAIDEMFADMKDLATIEDGMQDSGATGAKIAARCQFQNPQHLDDWDELPGYLQRL